jgi:Zn-dependent M28 family amino/carboxypeptidase
MLGHCALRFVVFSTAVFVACSLRSTGEFTPAATDAALRIASKLDGAALRPSMVEAFRNAGHAPVSEEYGTGDKSGTNVYVDIPGDTPEMVLVSGHHDAWFQSGADDNGSALAVMIEGARALKDVRLHRTIRFIAFDGEEEGFFGAHAYLARHRAEKVRMLLNMDCVGYASHEPGSQDAPAGFALEDTGDFVLVIANEVAHDDAARVVRLATRIPKSIDTRGLLAPDDSSYPGIGDFKRSDHAPFWDEGVPALFFGDTADFRNANYHTEDDTPETLDYEFMHAVAQLVIGAAVAFATND